MFCERCGKELPEKAVFCPYCGAKIEVMPAPKQEVVDPKPVEAKKEARKTRYTDEEIEKMREELVAHRRRQSNFSVAGGILLGIGIALTVLGIILFVTCTVNVAESGQANGNIVGIVFGYLGLVFGIVMTVGAIPLLVVSSAVFGKKADNRERAIKEHEQGK